MALSKAVSLWSNKGHNFFKKPVIHIIWCLFYVNLWTPNHRLHIKFNHMKIIKLTLFLALVFLQIQAQAAEVTFG